MITLAEIKDHCFVDEAGHWIYRGAYSNGTARIYAPDYSKDPSGRRLTVQRGPRAIHHLKTGQPMLLGWRAWSCCDVPTCINPDCITAGPNRMYRAAMRRRTAGPVSVLRVLANRQNGEKQRKVTQAIANDILGSSDSNLALAARHSLSRETVARVRRGELRIPGNPFQGLMP